MNYFQTISLSILSTLFLTGCANRKHIPRSRFFSDIAVPLNNKKNRPLSETELKRWNHMDIVKDTIPGMSVDRTYAELMYKMKPKKVIVGIVDSGIDIEHEDLKSVIWTNPKEIPGNGIDDDNNGYVDDIHGWNFLGDITKENYEFERIINNKSLVNEQTYNEAVKTKEKKIAEAQNGKLRMELLLSKLKTGDSILVHFFGKPEYTVEEVKAIVSSDSIIQKNKMTIQQLFSFGMSLKDLKGGLEKQKKNYQELIASAEKPYFNYREVLGDNPEDITDTKYGNNNVIGPDKAEALHGTHVSGIVAQIRNNNIGGDGIADNVEIMAVRAVPDGDEYDKDIALAIRYAVDNGAKVINGSFGKAFSPQKQWVFDAIRYAAAKDVLIVHAAGNDAKNIDYYDNFPNDSEDKINEISDNLITVGALNYEYGENVVATFSNIGKINVDVFAPGVKIYATTPENTYKFLKGTSMAAPNVAGVAALIRSYFPKLTAVQVKHILMDSGVAIDRDVIVGGNPKDVRPFATLCKSGKMVNAYNAILMADKMSRKK